MTKNLGQLETLGHKKFHKSILSKHLQNLPLRLWIRCGKEAWTDCGVSWAGSTCFLEKLKQGPFLPSFLIELSAIYSNLTADRLSSVELSRQPLGCVQLLAFAVAHWMDDQTPGTWVRDWALREETLTHSWLQQTRLTNKHQNDNAV